MPKQDFTQAEEVSQQIKLIVPKRVILTPGGGNANLYHIAKNPASSAQARMAGRISIEVEEAWTVAQRAMVTPEQAEEKKKTDWQLVREPSPHFETLKRAIEKGKEAARFKPKSTVIHAGNSTIRPIGEGQ